MTDKERLEKIKEIDITPLCFYLNEMTNFDGKLLKGYWKRLIKQAERAETLERLREEDSTYYNELLTKLREQNECYKQALEYIQRAIYTQHCTMNHKWNTEFEKGQISGLIQASNIVEKAIKRMEEGK